MKVKKDRDHLCDVLYAFRISKDMIANLDRDSVMTFEDFNVNSLKKSYKILFDVFR